MAVLWLRWALALPVRAQRMVGRLVAVLWQGRGHPPPPLLSHWKAKKLLTRRRPFRSTVFQKS